MLKFTVQLTGKRLPCYWFTNASEDQNSIINVDWGDGNQEQITLLPSSMTFSFYHEYASIGQYDVSMDITGGAVYLSERVAPNIEIFSDLVVKAVIDDTFVPYARRYWLGKNLKELTVLKDVPDQLSAGGINTTSLETIYVPYSKYDDYVAAWSAYAKYIRRYIPMKEVTSGAHYTTVTVDTAEEVKFSFPSTSLSVEASGGDITVALTDTAQAGDDETITVPDGESRMFIHHRMNIDTYYLTGSGTAKLYASNMGDVNPFKAGKRGGDGGGDTTHYKGTTTTPLENGSTTNPIVIDGESYTAVFGDVVVYGYTEFVFDGTTWSEFGRPFDTVPTQGSTNAVTSDGIYQRTPLARGTGVDSVVGGGGTASTLRSFAFGYGAVASNTGSTAFGSGSGAQFTNQFVCGQFNNQTRKTLFTVGNGSSGAARSNIVEVNSTSANVNGDIQINNVNIPTPYTTMPTITESMLGKIAMYVGATGNGYTQGCFYVASTDGAAEPTYSWVQIGGTLGVEEVTLWENDGTTNPETVTLSEPITNFDEFIIEATYTTTDGGRYRYTNTWLVSADLIGMKLQLNDEEHYVACVLTTSTTLTDFGTTSRPVVFTKIIGRRYTKVSPTGYRQTVLWENEGTTNPETITLSEAWSDFDELVIVTDWLENDAHIWGYNTVQNIYNSGDMLRLWYYDNTVYGTYVVTSATVLTRYGGNGSNWLSKIIGIKY